MKYCPVVPEICRGHIHVAKKERRRRIIIRRNGAKTISLQTTFGRLNKYREPTVIESITGTWKVCYTCKLLVT